MKKVLFIVIPLVFAYWWFKGPSIHTPSYDISFSYIVKYTGNSDKNVELPMLVALHGNGDTVDNFYNTALDKITVPMRIILIKGPMPKGRGSAWPWRAADFTQYGKALNEAIELLTVKYPTVKKPILLGFSGGAVMAYYQAVKYGNSYSYIFPISGLLSNKELGNGVIKTGAKVFAFHGRKDKLVSINGGRDAVKILQENGAKVKFVEFDGGHHGIFTNMKSKITRVIEQKIESLK